MIKWDFTDISGDLRYSKNGDFINDADHSQFDPSAESPKLLEALYKR